MTGTLPEYVDGLPNLSGQEALISEAIAAARRRSALTPPIDLAAVSSTFAIALHMHQPLIPAGGRDLQTAGIISNLQYMMENQGDRRQPQCAGASIGATSAWANSCRN